MQFYTHISDQYAPFHTKVINAAVRGVELRRRVQIGLNKGEAKNELARAVFLNRLGEIRDHSFENQCYRASGLNLVVCGNHPMGHGQRTIFSVS